MDSEISVVARCVQRQLPLRELRLEVVPGADETSHAALQRALRSARTLPQAGYVRVVVGRLLELAAAAPDAQEGWYDLLGAVEAGALPTGCHTYFLREPARVSPLCRARGIAVFHSALLSDVSSTVWPAALLLADAVVALGRRHPAAFAGRPMVELGAGSGLSGQLVAATHAVPVSRVLLTDGDVASTARLRDHLRSNGCGGGNDCNDGGGRGGPVVTAAVLEWASFASSGSADGGAEDGGLLGEPSQRRVVIGSDLVYDPAALRPLAGTLRRLLSATDGCGEETGACLTDASAGGNGGGGFATLLEGSFGVVATTVRNPETYRAFLSALEAAGLLYRDVTTAVNSWIPADGGSVVDTRVPGAPAEGGACAGAANAVDGALPAPAAVKWDIRVAIVTAASCAM
jgi:predicted nicotinamide N-methyase